MQYRFKDSQWDMDCIECYPFYHVDWRESDVVTVYSPNDERIGFIVSQSVVFTEDNEIIDNAHLYKYLSRWLKDKLECEYLDISSKIYDNIQIEDDLCYLLLHKPSLSYLNDDNASILAFMFSRCFSKIKSSFFLSSETQTYLRDKILYERQRILKIFETEASKYFLHECIPKIHSMSDPLSQFVVLYQFFEVLMEISFEPKLKLAYERFEQHLIGKNDFRQIVSNLSKESSLITELLKNVSNKSFDLITANEKQQYFIDSEISTTSDIVYSLRNTIFHRTRVFMGSEEMLRKVNYAILNCIYECMKTDMFELQKKLPNKSIEGAAGSGFR